VSEKIAAGQPWTDPDFPPSDKILFDPVNDKKDRAIKYEGIEFRRANEIYTEPTLFSDDCAVRQGGIGNCYLLAVMSAMVERGQFDMI